MEAVAGRFEVGVTERGGLFPGLALRAGDGVRVFVDGEPLLHGFVDSINRSISATDHSVSLSGRDRTGEMVDASTIVSPGTWTDTPLEAIAAQIAAPFGIPVMTVAATGAPIKKFSVQRGESAFSAIERAAKPKKVLLTTNGIGALVITKPGSLPAGDVLVEGENILSANQTQDYKERFSRYIVYGQQAGQTGKAGTGVKAENPDHLLEFGGLPVSKIAGVAPRHRPLVIIAEGEVNLDQAYRRAEWETTVRRARSEKLTVSVRGWRTRSGPLWQPNRLVICRIPSLGVTGPFLITATRFELGQSGTTTQLTLRHRRAFAPGP